MPTDPVELRLLELEQALMRAWQACTDRTSPLGELAALAAATRTFYQERERERKRTPPGTHPDQHWSHKWKRTDDQT